MVSAAGSADLLSEDALDPSTNSDAMSIGYCRYAAGQSNRVTGSYDEALIVVKGAFSVSDDAGVKTTAQVGETIFLTKDTSVLYSVEEDTEIVYVTYPRWEQSLCHSEQARVIDTYAIVEGGPPDLSGSR